MNNDIEYEIIGKAEMCPNVYGGKECDEIKLILREIKIPRMP